MNQWKKRGIEGTLFLYERTKEPKYGFLVLNRLGLDNLQIDLRDIQIQPSGEYLMYKMGDTVHGLWIFGKEDRERLAAQLESLLKPTTVKQVSLEEIWSALEGMAPHSSQFLSEAEFLARFQILVQVLYSQSRAHFLPGPCTLDIFKIDHPNKSCGVCNV
jgi:hypothetical protein